MAEKNINEIIAAQKRAALLALAADNVGNAGTCLTTAVMTAFLDGTCSFAEKETALRHISLCRRCYGEWLILAELQLESGRKHRKKSVRPFFLRPVNIAAITSAMAAMVCIGLFLDINPFNYRIDKQAVPPVITMKEELPKTPPSVQALQNRVTTDTAAVPAPAKIKEKQSIIPQKKTTSVEKVVERQISVRPNTITPHSLPTPAEKPALTSPHPADAEQSAGSAAPLEMAVKQEIQKTGQHAISLSQWQEELIALCRQQETANHDKDRLHQLFTTGKKALPIWRHLQATPSADRSLQLLVLRILEGAQSEEQVIENCQEILTEVERKSR